MASLVWTILKTQPDYPAFFNDENHARSWCGDFFDWRNDAHQHSGLNGHIPADVFYGRAEAITIIKQMALDSAYRRHPERFVNGAPRAKSPPDIVSINPLPASVISLPTPMRNAEIQSDANELTRSLAIASIQRPKPPNHAPSEVAKLH